MVPKKLNACAQRPGIWKFVAGLHPSCSISLCDECPDRQRSETQVIGARFRDLIANMPHDVLWFIT